MRDVRDQLRDWSQLLADSIDPIEIDAIKEPTPEPANAFARRWIAIAASTILVAGGILAVARLGGDEPRPTVPVTNPQFTTGQTTATTAPDTAATTNPEVAAPPITSAPTSTPETTPTGSSIPTQPEDRLADWPTPPSPPIPVDDIPRLLPSTEIGVPGVPVRGQADAANVVRPYTQIFADADRDVLLTIQTTPNEIESTPTEMRRPITIDGWQDAYLTDGGLRLVASAPSGFIRLMGTGIDEDEAAALVAAMQRRSTGIPGWDLPPASRLVEINGAWNDSAGQRFLTWFEGDRVVAQMLTSPAHTDLINQALAPAFEQVDVNGTPGWINPNDGRRSIVWSPDGETIVVLGVVDDRIDPLAVAQSVTDLTVEEYESRTTTEIPAGVGDGCDGSLFC